MNATSASDRYDAARKALKLAISRQAHTVPGSCRECDDLDVYIEALRALIEPPATEETPEEIAARAVATIGTYDEADTDEEQIALTIQRVALSAVHAGIQAAWESWESENSPGYEPEQSTPAFKPEGEPDEYREQYHNLVNWGQYRESEYGPNLGTMEFQSVVGAKLRMDVTASQVRHILEMLSSEAGA